MLGTYTIGDDQLANEVLSSPLPQDYILPNSLIMINNAPTQKFFLPLGNPSVVQFQFDVASIIPEQTLDGYFTDFSLKRFVSQASPSLLLSSQTQPGQFTVVNPIKGIIKLSFLAADTSNLQAGNYYAEFAFRNSETSYVYPFPLSLFATIAKGLF